MLNIFKILLFIIFIAAMGTLFNGGSLPVLGEGVQLAVLGVLAGALNIVISVYQAKTAQKDVDVSGVEITDDGTIEHSNMSAKTKSEVELTGATQDNEASCLFINEIDELLAISKNKPVLLITGKAERGAGEESAILNFMKYEFPLLYEKVKKYDCNIVWHNIGLTAKRTTIRKYLDSKDMKYRGAFLFKDGKCVNNVKFKFLDVLDGVATKSASLFEAS